MNFLGVHVQKCYLKKVSTQQTWSTFRSPSRPEPLHASSMATTCVTVHFDTTPAKRPLEDDDAQETAGDGGVDAEPADADDAHTAKRRRKDDSKVAKVALAERLVEASDSEEDGHAEEEEGQAEEEDVDSDDDNEGDVRVKGKMARKSPNAEQLALARRLVAAIDKPAELTQIFTERYDSLPGDEHIESHRKYVFQIAKGQNSVLSPRTRDRPVHREDQDGRNSGAKRAHCQEDCASAKSRTAGPTNRQSANLGPARAVQQTPCCG